VGHHQAEKILFYFGLLSFICYIDNLIITVFDIGVATLLISIFISHFYFRLLSHRQLIRVGFIFSQTPILSIPFFGCVRR